MAGISGTVGGGRGRGAKNRHLYEEAQARRLNPGVNHITESVRATYGTAHQVGMTSSKHQLQEKKRLANEATQRWTITPTGTSSLVGGWSRHSELEFLVRCPAGPGPGVNSFCAKNGSQSHWEGLQEERKLNQKGKAEKGSKNGSFLAARAVGGPRIPADDVEDSELAGEVVEDVVIESEMFVGAGVRSFSGSGGSSSSGTYFTATEEVQGV